MMNRKQVEAHRDLDIKNVKRIRANGASFSLEMYALGRVDAFITVLGTKPKATRPIKRPHPHRPAKPIARHSGFLCEDNISGCSCNQSASVGQ